MKSLVKATLSVALALVAVACHAASPDNFLQVAGPPPSEARVRMAILKYLQRTEKALDKRKPFKVLSGPTLATGNTFGGSLEQAWLMCLVVNIQKKAPGTQKIEGQALYLRNLAGDVVVVPLVNWKDSSPQC